MSAVQSDLGRIAPINKGPYAAGTTYEKLDIVSYNGSSYMYINDTSGSGHAPTDTSYWSIMAQKGADGSVPIDDSSTAANKVWSASKVNSLIGTLSSLMTTVKTSIVAAINEIFKGNKSWAYCSFSDCRVCDVVSIYERKKHLFIR